jgi:hypothetical protein
MFNTLRDIAKQSVDVLETHAALAEKRFRRLGALVALLVCVGIVGGAAACGVLAGIVLLLTPPLGVAGAILVTAGVTLAVCIAGLALWIARRHDAVQTAQVAAAAARADWNEAVSPRKDDASGKGASEKKSDGDHDDLVHMVIDAVTSNPAIIAGGAFALVSLLGAGRTITAVRTAVALASAGFAASRIVTSRNGLFNTTCDPPSRGAHNGTERDSRRKTAGGPLLHRKRGDHRQPGRPAS